MAANESTTLTPGERHRWRIRAHHPFGLVVEAVDLNSVVGVVDVMFFDPDKAKAAETWPPVGSVVDAVVQGYTPSGELRLSMLPDDLVEHG